MKKLIAIVLTGVLAFSLTACGNSANLTEGEVTQADTQSNDNNQAQEPVDTLMESDTKPETEGEVPQEETQTEDAAPEENGESVLVAYFSWSGNTQQLAEMVHSAAGGDLFEIQPETPYTEDYDELLDVAQQEKGEDARPVLSSHVENWENYSTIFVGYPNWWSDAPMVILSFLEEYDCSGKTIIPFCTSGGGGFGGSISSITDSAAGATIVEGFHVSGSSVSGAEGDVAAWVESLSLAQ